VLVAKWNCAKMALVTIMRCWSGVVQLTADDLGLKTLVHMLRDFKVLFLCVIIYKYTYIQKFIYMLCIYICILMYTLIIYIYIYIYNIKVSPDAQGAIIDAISEVFEPVFSQVICVDMYIYVYVYKHTYLYAYLWIHMHMFIHTNTYIYIYSHIFS
jgi:hypothetical protein